jgi:hypothetical protein
MADLVIFVGIILSGVVMTGLGLEMTGDPNASKRKGLYRLLFIGLGSVFIGLSVWQFVRADTAANRSERERHEADLRNKGNFKYQQGQLDTMTKILHDLSVSSTPQQWMAALKSAIPKIVPSTASAPPSGVPSSPSATLSDGQMFSLKKGVKGLPKGRLRLICIGGKPATTIECDQIVDIFAGWAIDRENSGMIPFTSGTSYITGPDISDKSLVKVFSVFDNSGATQFPLIPNSYMGNIAGAPPIVIVVDH